MFSRERRRQRMRAFLADFERDPSHWELPPEPDFRSPAPRKTSAAPAFEASLAHLPSFDPYPPAA